MSRGRKLAAAALAVAALSAGLSLWHSWRRANVPGRELSTVPGVSIKYVGAQPAPEAWSVRVRGPDEMGLCRLEAKSAGLFQILSRVSPGGRWVFDDAGLPAGCYDVSVVASDGGREALWPPLAAACEEAFDVRIRERPRVCEVNLLAARKGGPSGLRPAGSGGVPGIPGMPGGAGWEFRRRTMDQLAALLEERLQAPVINETGLSGEYDFELAWDSLEPGKIAGAVERLGLRLDKARRTIRAVVIEKR